MSSKKHASISEKQRQLMMEFFKSNFNLITGKFSASFTQNDSKNKWIELSEILNSIPHGAIKDWKMWRKTWQDLKSRSKLKAYYLQNNILDANGCEPKSLSLVEEEIIQLINSASSNELDEDEDMSQVETMEAVDWVTECSRESEDPIVFQNDESSNSVKVKHLEDEEISFVDDPLLTSDNELPVVEQQVPKPKYNTKLSTAVKNETKVDSTSNKSFHVESTEDMSSRKIKIKKLAMKAKYYERKLALFERDVLAKEQIAVALTTLATDASKDWAQH